MLVIDYQLLNAEAFEQMGMKTVNSVLLIVAILASAKVSDGLVDLKMPSAEDVPGPPDFSKIKSEDVLAAIGAPKKVIDPRGIDLMSLTKVCTPNWIANNSVWEDARCMKWPEVCDYMPSPPPIPFATFTEMFPCFVLDKIIILRVAQLQHAALTSIEKCMWDYILMFLNACYPGLDPRVLIEMIRSGKLTDGIPSPLKVNLDKGPVTVPSLFG